MQNAHSLFCPFLLNSPYSLLLLQCLPIWDFHVVQRAWLVPILISRVIKMLLIIHQAPWSMPSHYARFWSLKALAPKLTSEIPVIQGDNVIRGHVTEKCVLTQVLPCREVVKEHSAKDWVIPVAMTNGRTSHVSGRQRATQHPLWDVLSRTHGLNLVMSKQQRGQHWGSSCRMKVCILRTDQERERLTNCPRAWKHMTTEGNIYSG